MKKEEISESINYFRWTNPDYFRGYLKINDWADFLEDRFNNWIPDSTPVLYLDMNDPFWVRHSLYNQKKRKEKL